MQDRVRMGVLERIATLSVRHRRRVLIGSALFFVVAGIIASTALNALSANGGFGDPRTDSTKSTYIASALSVGTPGLVMLVHPEGNTVESPAGQQAGLAITAEVTRRVIASGGTADDVQSYWDYGLPLLRSPDHKTGLISIRITEMPDAALAQSLKITTGLQQAVAGDHATVEVGGPAAIYQQLSDTTKSDLQKADRIAIPITAIFLVLIFGSAVAAVLPLVIGVLSIVGALTVLRLLVLVTPVSVFGADLAAALGLGLGIDYALFVLTRFREEVAAGRSADDAAVKAIMTAGRTVLFSALTVAAALSALCVFHLYYLRSFGYAGVAGTALAAICAVVVLPALIVTLAPWLDRGDLRKPIRRVLRLPPPSSAGLSRAGEGFWHRVAMTVMRRPVLLGGSVMVLLVLVGLPFLGVRFGLPDDNALPPQASSHVAMDSLRHDFGTSSLDAITITAASQDWRPDVMNDYERTLSLLPHAGRVEGPAGAYEHGVQVSKPDYVSEGIYEPWGGTWVQLSPTVQGFSKEGIALVRAVRALRAPFPGAVVGGAGAQLVDIQHSIVGDLPVAIGIVVSASLIVLFLFTGSIVIPLKALLMTLLSLTASFGLMVWGFQDGHLAKLLNFSVSGTLDTSIPILMFCIVFGLSMDYEVFLLSRVKEEYDRTGDNVAAVALGLERTGRVVSAAALLLATVMLAFAASGVVFIKLLGVGASIAVIVDATLVRGVLVPSFMRLLGDANWWAPAPLKRFWERFGLREAPDAVAVPAQPEVIDLREPELIGQ